jgi:hypothetical protein
MWPRHAGEMSSNWPQAAHQLVSWPANSTGRPAAANQRLSSGSLRAELIDGGHQTPGAAANRHDDSPPTRLHKSREITANRRPLVDVDRFN